MAKETWSYLPIMYGNRMGWLALTKTPLFALSMERMNFLDAQLSEPVASEEKGLEQSGASRSGELKYIFIWIA